MAERDGAKGSSGTSLPLKPEEESLGCRPGCRGRRKTVLPRPVISGERKSLVARVVVSCGLLVSPALLISSPTAAFHFKTIRSFAFSVSTVF